MRIPPVAMGMDWASGASELAAGAAFCSWDASRERQSSPSRRLGLAAPAAPILFPGVRRPRAGPAPCGRVPRLNVRPAALATCDVLRRWSTAAISGVRCPRGGRGHALVHPRHLQPCPWLLPGPPPRPKRGQAWADALDATLMPRQAAPAAAPHMRLRLVLRLVLPRPQTEHARRRGRAGWVKQSVVLLQTLRLGLYLSPWFSSWQRARRRTRCSCRKRRWGGDGRCRHASGPLLRRALRARCPLRPRGRWKPTASAARSRVPREDAR